MVILWSFIPFNERGCIELFSIIYLYSLSIEVENALMGVFLISFMEAYKQEFIEFLVRCGALKFGEFTLKSGRKCPYFLNVGQFYMGSVFDSLTGYYAQALHNMGSDFDVIFGPAYKGIPLCVGTAMAFYRGYKRDVGYSYNRKEAKDHGEGGLLVGAPITAGSRVVIVDDVMTAGTALRESLEFLKTFGAPKIAGVLIAVDRMEKGQGDKSAVQEVQAEFGIEVHSIVTLEDIIEALYNKPVDGKVYIDDEQMRLIKDYRDLYGV